MAKHKVYTFYAELNDYEPKIWRRFEVNGEKTMAELSYAIMIMFEMQASHLFGLTEYVRDAFTEYMSNNDSVEIVDDVTSDILQRFKNIRYEFPYDEVFLKKDEELIIPDTIRLNSTISIPGTRFLFEYDYGDVWEISLVLENIRQEDISLTLLPRVLQGEGYGIVEDVGGVVGLTHLAEVLKHGTGDEVEIFNRWLDSTTLNLESFDKDDINFRLKKVMRIYRDSYEYGYEPTKASLKLLNRDYLGKGSRGY